MTKLTTIGALCSAIIAGALAGSFLTSHSAPEDEHGAGRATKDLDELRRAVGSLQSEVRAVRLNQTIDRDASREPVVGDDGTTPKVVPSEEVPEEDELLPKEIDLEQEEHFVRGQHLVDDAIVTGRWTEKDADALGRLTDRLTPENHGRLMQQIAVAINEGRLRPDNPRIF